jgi:GT2 family glycosyltransferase
LTSPSVAIVILNWNGKKFLEQFLPSVLATTYSNCKVVVADNASGDDSIQFLQQHFPQVEIISLPENYGFAKGYDEALKKVTADYYVLLNSDVEVTPGWLEPIVELLEQDSSHAASQPKILSYHNRGSFEYAGACGGWMDAYGYPFSRGRVFDICEKDNGQYNETQKIFWATGAAMVIRSTVFHEQGGFDDYLFAHMEEIDLCWRMQLAGYKIFCCPQSVVYHVGGGTLPKGNSRKTFLNYRNNKIILARNLPWSEKWWKVPFRMALDQVAALKMLLSGDSGYFAAVVKAHLAFIRWIFAGKKKISRSRKRPITDLDGVYKGNVAWQHFVKKKRTFTEIVSRES